VRFFRVKELRADCYLEATMTDEELKESMRVQREVIIVTFIVIAAILVFGSISAQVIWEWWSK
jgi:hypothetical protein